jgi:hypothetical protein
LGDADFVLHFVVFSNSEFFGKTVGFGFSGFKLIGHLANLALGIINRVGGNWSFDGDNSDGAEQQGAHQNLSSQAAHTRAWAKTQHDPCRLANITNVLQSGYSHSMVPGGFDVMS